MYSTQVDWEENYGVDRRLLLTLNRVPIDQ